MLVSKFSCLGPKIVTLQQSLLCEKNLQTDCRAPLRGGIEDNSLIIFLVSLQKRML